MPGLITKMLIFVVLMVIGYGFGRRDGTGSGFAKAMSSLVINVFMCATILSSVLTADMDLSAGKLGEILLVVFACIGLQYLLAAGITRFLPIEKERKGPFELLLAVPNNMFIALPVLDELFGPTAVFYCGLSNIPFNLFLYTYGIWRLRKGEDGGGPRARDMISAPLVATLAALLLFLTKLPVPGIVRELITTMSGATLPLSMVVIGASLSTVSLLDAFKNWRFYLSSFFKLLLAPLFVWLVCGLLTKDPVLLATAAIIAAAPSGVLVSVLTIKYGGDYIFTSEGILHSTVLSMLTIPVLVFLLI